MFKAVTALQGTGRDEMFQGYTANDENLEFSEVRWEISQLKSVFVLRPGSLSNNLFKCVRKPKNCASYF